MVFEDKITNKIGDGHIYWGSDIASTKLNSPFFICRIANTNPMGETSLCYITENASSIIFFTSSLNVHTTSHLVLIFSSCSLSPSLSSCSTSCLPPFVPSLISVLCWPVSYNIFPCWNSKQQYVNNLIIRKWHHRWHKKWVWYWTGADKWRKTFSSCLATVYCEEKVRNIVANMSFILHSFFLLPFPIVSQKLLFKEVFLY